MRILGIVLIICGVLALVYGGFTYFSTDKVADVGPVQVHAERAHTVWIPPVLGVVGIALGALMVLSGRRTVVVE
jgi:hypothetical protein